MTPPDNDQVSDAVAESLLAYDEQLAGDSRTGQDDTAPLRSAEEQRRLEELRDCVNQLELVRLIGGVRLHRGDDETRAAAYDETPSSFPVERIARFEIRRELGRGGCGIVFLAHDPKLARLVALKVPRPEALVSDEMRRRFLREAQVAARLDHANLVTVHEVGEDGTICYIASTYCDGPTLAQWLAARERPIAPRQAAELLAELSDAVEYAHAQGVLHRDIKPSNVLLVSRRETNGDHRVGGLDVVPKLSDFGLAKLLEAEGDVTRTGALVGTPAYMSPEQAQGHLSEIGPPTDVYALGVLLYEMLVGRPPFRGAGEADTLRQIVTDEPKSPRRMRQDVPHDLEAICLRCLEKRPTSRYLSARDLGDDLRRFLAGEPTAARPIGFWQRGVKWARRRPALAALASVSALLLVGLTVGGWWSSVRLRAALQTSEQHRQRAQASEAETERRLYASDVHLAFQAWQTDDAPRMREYLSRQIPEPGEPDRRGFSWHLLWALCHTERAVLTGHDGDVYAVAYAPDGRVFATAGKDGTIRIWDANTLTTRTVLTEHEDEVNCLAFSPDGRWLASGSDDATVRLWDVQRDFTPTATLPHPEGALTVSFSPESSQLASGGRDAIVRLWDFGSAVQTSELKGHTDYVQSLAFSPDQQLLASASDDCMVRLWDLEDLGRFSTLDARAGRCAAAAFSHDARVLATGYVDGSVRLWDVASGEESTTLLEHAAEIHSLDWSADDSLLVSTARDGLVRVWDVLPEQSVKLIGHDGGVWSAAFSPDGKALVACGADATVRVFDASSIALERVSSPHFRGATNVAFSPDGRLLARAGMDHCVSLLDIATNETLAQLGSHHEVVSSVVFAPDGRTLVSASHDRTIAVWDVTTRGLRERLSVHGDAVVNLAYSSDGRYLASVGDDHRLIVWNASAWTPVHELQVQVGGGALDFSPDARWLVAADGHALRRWRVSDWREVKPLEQHAARIKDVAFSPDGRRIATASDDRTVCIWDAAEGDSVSTLPARSHAVRGVSFSPDGRELALGSVRGAVSVFDLHTHQELISLGKGHDYSSVEFSADGKSLAVSTVDGREAVFLWTTNRSPSGRSWQSVVGRQPSLVQPAVATDAANAPEATVSELPPWRALRLQPTATRVASFTPDGRALATCSNAGRLILWDTKSGRIRTEIDQPEMRQAVNALALTPDSDRIVTSVSEALCLWDVSTRTLRRQFGEEISLQAGRWGSVAVAPDGQFLVAACPDGSSRLFALADGSTTATWPGEFLALSRDGTIAASLNLETWAIELRDVTTSEITAHLHGHTNQVVRGDFSRDGSLLATLSERDRSLRVWDLRAGRESYCLQGETGASAHVALAFSPTDDLLVTAGGDNVIRLRAAANGEPVAAYELHTGRVHELVFSHDGRFLASAGRSEESNGEIYLWSVDAMLEAVRWNN